MRELRLGLISLLIAFPARAQCADGTPPPCNRPVRAAAPAANSVAVLYFENQSRDTSDSYLATGLTEAIIAKLGDIPRLTVKSRYLVRRYQGDAAHANPSEIGRALGGCLVHPSILVRSIVIIWPGPQHALRRR